MRVHPTPYATFSKNIFTVKVLMNSKLDFDIAVLKLNPLTVHCTYTIFIGEKYHVTANILGTGKEAGIKKLLS